MSEAMSEEERLRRQLAEILEHPNAVLVAAMYAEFDSRPGWGTGKLAAQTSLSRTTIYDWFNGVADPTLSHMVRLVEDLHPDDPSLGRLPRWLMRGEDYVARMESRIAELERLRRREEVRAAMLAAAEREEGATTIVKLVEELDEAGRMEVLRRLAERWAKDFGSRPGSDPRK